MGVKGYIERKKAQKELGVGSYQTKEENYSKKVEAVAGILRNKYNTASADEKKQIDNMFLDLDLTKSENLCSCLAKYLLIGTSGALLNGVYNNVTEYLPHLVGFSSLALASYVWQKKSKRNIYKANEQIKDVFGLTGSENKESLIFEESVSERTKNSCFSDALESFIEQDVLEIK